MVDMALSARYGLPPVIPITDHKRYSYCDAREAILVDVSPDGKYATYQGTCTCGHLYREKREVEELRQKTKVVLNADGSMAYQYDPKHSSEVPVVDKAVQLGGF